MEGCAHTEFTSYSQSLLSPPGGKWKIHILGREAKDANRPKPRWSLHNGQAEGVQVLPTHPGDSSGSSRLTNSQVKTCLAILDKYQPMLRSVLKEGFRGGREATVEQLTEQFCQKVEPEL